MILDDHIVKENSRNVSHVSIVDENITNELELTSADMADKRHSLVEDLNEVLVAWNIGDSKTRESELLALVEHQIERSSDAADLNSVVQVGRVLLDDSRVQVVAWQLLSGNLRIVAFVADSVHVVVEFRWFAGFSFQAVFTEHLTWYYLSIHSIK